MKSRSKMTRSLFVIAIVMSSIASALPKNSISTDVINETANYKLSHFQIQTIKPAAIIVEGLFTRPITDDPVIRGLSKSFQGILNLYEHVAGAEEDEYLTGVDVAISGVTMFEGVCTSIDSKICRGTAKISQGGLGLVKSVVAFLDSDDAVEVCESVCDVVKSGAIIAEGVCTFTANPFCRGTAKMAQGGFDWIKGRICPILTTFDKDDYFDKDYLDFNGTCVLRY